MTNAYRLTLQDRPEIEPCGIPTPKHGTEVMLVDGNYYCLGCLFDAVIEQYGHTQRWFGSNSKYGKEIIELGVKPLSNITIVED